MVELAKEENIMYQVGDFVVYKRDVCKIDRIMVNYFRGKDYYLMIPIDDKSLSINVPVENKQGQIKPILSKDEVNKIINNIPNIKVIDIDDKALEQEYIKFLNSDDHEDLVRIIKTTYMRNKARTDNKKKISEKDDKYFKSAERLLYNEFSASLGLSYDETKNYIINKLS